MSEKRTPNNQPEDLRAARLAARKKKRRQLMIRRTLLVLAMYLICLGVLLGSLYLYFRHPAEEDVPDEMPEDQTPSQTINNNQL